MCDGGVSSELNFKAKLLVGIKGSQTEYSQFDPVDNEGAVGEEDAKSPDNLRAAGPVMQASSVFHSVDGKRVTNFKNQIPVEMCHCISDRSVHSWSLSMWRGP